MGTIGEQIKKYRIEKGITQEQLGKMIGVTTQGVSRWERGGTPDAELLPRLSEILGVSIDALFGREEKSLTLTLARHLAQLSPEEVFRYAFTICWAVELGMVGDVSTMDDFIRKFLDTADVNEGKKNDYFAKVVRDSGISFVRMSPDLNHFFLMVEPKGRLLDQLSDVESLRKVFALLADAKLLKIICFLYGMPPMPVSTSLISKHIGLSQQETDRCMDILLNNHLVTHTQVATAEGEINAYAFRKEGFVVPLLCFADEIAKKDFRPFMGEFNRKKPLI